jgi:hypothetical protein
VETIDVAQDCQHGVNQTNESKDLCDRRAAGTFSAEEKKRGAESEKSKRGWNGHSAGWHSGIGQRVSQQHLIDPEVQLEKMFSEG